MRQTAEHIICRCRAWANGLAGIAKALLFSRWNNRSLHRMARLRAELVILGNGPSLRDFLAGQSAFLADKELMCVNLAVCSPDFVQLRPRYYIATDPVVFYDPDSCERLFGSLSRQTVWELHLFLPYRYRKLAGWRERIGDHPHIRVHFINTTPIEGADALTFPLYRRMLGMPRPRNILTPALMSALWMGYRTIYTAGVEHSWHNQLWVNDRNELMINDTHFYDGSTAQERRHGDFRMDTIFRSLYITFASYHTIERFARWIGAKVWNLTEGSFIDAFERKRPGSGQ